MLAPRPSIICVTGPTASGKSALALELAKRLGGEIINADSVQVYRGADIGAAKPSLAEQTRVKHHLLDIVAPDEEFNAAKFRAAAAKVISSLSDRGVVPIVSGGTGLYIRSLLGGLVETPPITEEAENAFRAHRLSGGNLYDWLQTIDPYSAEALSPNDVSRIRRAILVHLSSGESLRRLQEQHRHETTDYRALVLCLLPDRSELYSAVNTRTRRMLERGLVEEVRTLRAGFPPSCKIFDAIGYRRVCEYLEGSLPSSRLEESISMDTRRFAKRQLTWWRHQPAALGWTAIDILGDRTMTAVKPQDREKIIERLADAMKNFLSREEPLAADTVYFADYNRFPVFGIAALPND